MVRKWLYECDRSGIGYAGQMYDDVRTCKTGGALVYEEGEDGDPTTCITCINPRGMSVLSLPYSHVVTAFCTKYAFLETAVALAKSGAGVRNVSSIPREGAKRKPAG